MKCILLTFIFAAVTILEITFLPALVGTTVPPLGLFVAVLGLAVLDRGRFWFLLVSGVVRDAFSLQAAFTYTLWFLLLFLVVWFFDATVPLVESPRRIARLAVGLSAAPLLFALMQGVELENAFLGRDIVSGALLLVTAAGVLLLRAQQERMRRLSHLEGVIP